MHREAVVFSKDYTNQQPGKHDCLCHFDRFFTVLAITETDVPLLASSNSANSSDISLGSHKTVITYFFPLQIPTASEPNQLFYKQQQKSLVQSAIPSP